MPATQPPRRLGRPSKQAATDGPDTATALLQAAVAEFVERGYGDTDTNRIARRAGFAPQTFYRWYSDKLDIFIKVYQAWEEAEHSMLDSLLTERASPAQIAQRWVQGHQSFLQFRRSLRELCLLEPRVRDARTTTRHQQIQHILSSNPHAPDEATLAALLIQIERLSEALAEGEIDDLKLDTAPAYAALAGLIAQLRP